MSGYTPTTDEVRENYDVGRWNDGVGAGSAEGEFDRWLAIHDRQASEKALMDAAANFDQHNPQFATVYLWLRARAAEVRWGAQ